MATRLSVIESQFGFAVAVSVLDSGDYPYLEERHDETAIPSTEIPVELTNLHSRSLGARSAEPPGPDGLAGDARLRAR